MTFDPAILPEGEGDDEIERLTRRYAAALEPWIRARPELWLWMHSRWQRTRKQRRLEAIARLVEEARLPAAAPLDVAASAAAAGSPLRRLAQLANDDFVENACHLVVGPDQVAAAAFGRAIAGLGHATRWLTLGELRDRLARARDDGRLDAELRELDPIPLLVIDVAGALADAASIELLARLLAHRLDRGSVALAGASAAQWRDAAPAASPARAALDAFVDAAERIDVSSVDPRVLAVAASAGVADAADAAPADTTADASARALRA
jgi:hypothetical protein